MSDKKLEHVYVNDEVYNHHVKLAELACPYTFAKLIGGGAIYLVKKRNQLISSTGNRISEGYKEIIHATSGNTYVNSIGKIVPLRWNDLPENYRMDMIALNKEIRTYFGILYSHTHQNQDMSLNDRVASDVKTLLMNYKGRLLQIASNGSTFDVLPEDHVAVKATANTFLDHSGSLQKKPFGYMESDTHESVEKTYVHKGPREVGDFFTDLNTNNTNDTKTNNTMSFLNNIPGLNLEFGKFESDKIALGFDMKPVFKTANGGYAKVTEGKILEYQGDLKFDFEFFKVPVTSSALEIGDIIFDNNQLLIVDETAKGDIKFINPLTGNKSSTLVKTNLLGMFFYTKIVSLFSLGEGNAEGFGLNGLNPMMLMLLSQKGQGVSSSSDLLPLLLMSQGGQLGGSGGINPLMLMMMSGDKSKGSSGLSDMLPLLLMSQGQNGGSNPLANLFGQAKPVKKAAKPTKRLAPPSAPAKRIRTKTAATKA